MNFAQIIVNLEGEMTGASQGVQPITLQDSDFHTVEDQLGLKLPPDYRDFLKAFGCYVVYVNSPWPNGREDFCRLSAFLGVVPPDTPVKFDRLWDLRCVHEETAKERPREVLPIAMSSGNDYFCLRLDGDGYGRVYYWDRLIEFDCSDYTGLYLLANSFTEWMHALTLCED